MGGRAERDLVRARWFPGARERLGEGEEAEVYALDADRVLRLYKGASDPGMLERRRAFYDALARDAVSFALPRVMDQGEADGVPYAIERRIAGSSLEAALPGLEGAERRRAWLAYANAVTAIPLLGCPSAFYGELLAADPLRAASWPDFVSARAAACLAANRVRLSAQVPVAERALVRLRVLLDRRGPVNRDLIHGDYYPANVMVDPGGRVTGVVDFGALTLSGDSRFDGAGALLYLFGMPGVTEDDRQTVAERLGEQGLTKDDIALCRLFTAFRFLDTPKQSLFRWCVATMEEAR